MVICNHPIEGKYVKLVSATIEHVEETFLMRQYSSKTKYLHKISNSIEKQKEWIESQNVKEDDYFFVVYDKECNAIGTVGLYEINNSKAHIGRLLMYGNAIQSYETYLLVIQFGFNELNLSELYGDTDEKNTSAIKFSKMFGFKYEKAYYDSDMNRMVTDCTLSNEDFVKCSEIIKKMIYR